MRFGRPTPAPIRLPPGAEPISDGGQACIVTTGCPRGRLGDGRRWRRCVITAPSMTTCRGTESVPPWPTVTPRLLKHWLSWPLSWPGRRAVNGGRTVAECADHPVSEKNVRNVPVPAAAARLRRRMPPGRATGRRWGNTEFGVGHGPHCGARYHCTMRLSWHPRIIRSYARYICRVTGRSGPTHVQLITCQPPGPRAGHLARLTCALM